MTGRYLLVGGFNFEFVLWIFVGWGKIDRVFKRLSDGFDVDGFWSPKKMEKKFKNHSGTIQKFRTKKKFEKKF